VTVRAVTFDFWNTLVAAAPSINEIRLSGWVTIARAEGLEIGEAELLAHLERLLDELYVATEREARLDVARVVEDVLSQVEAQLPRRVWPALAEAITEAGAGQRPDVVPGLESCLDALGAAGCRIGLVSNVVLTPSRITRTYLGPLLGRFEPAIFSDEVGVLKPDPGIFRCALNGLGLAPREVAHVGDSRFLDVRGAQAAGLRTIRFAGFVDDLSPDEPEADAVATTMAEVPALVAAF
jgi:FMN phosphatase YigB (HAD superfamily)